MRNPRHSAKKAHPSGYAPCISPAIDPDFGLPYSPPTLYTGNYSTDISIMTGVYGLDEQDEQEAAQRQKEWERDHPEEHATFLQEQAQREAKAQAEAQKAEVEARALETILASHSPNCQCEYHDHPF